MSEKHPSEHFQLDSVNIVTPQLGGQSLAWLWHVNRYPAFKWKSFSRVQLFVTPWTVAHQAPLFVGILQGKKYWSGLPFLSPEDLPDTGLKPVSPALQVDSLLSEPPENLWKPSRVLFSRKLYAYFFIKRDVPTEMLLLLLLSCFSRVRLCVTP